MTKIMRQFSIYLPNKPGELKKLMMKVRRINLAAAATFASKDGAIMRLVPQDAGSFARILKQARVAFTKQDVVMLSAEDRPGGLLKILTKLQRAHVNIEGVYIVGGEGSNGSARCIIESDDTRKACEALA